MIDRNIEIVEEVSRVFGNRIASEPGVPPVESSCEIALRGVSEVLAEIAKGMKRTAALYREEGKLDEALLIIRVQQSVEETGEWAEALASGDLVRAFHELMDMSWVTDGHFLALGVAEHKAAGYEELRRANLSKLGEDGKPIISEAGRWVKGPNFVPADMAQVLGVEESS